MVEFQVKNQRFGNEEEAIKFWLGLGKHKNWFSIFKTNDGRVSQYTTRELTTEQVDECLRNFNTVHVNYKGSNKVYSYRHLEKIDLKNLDNIILLELRGCQGHIEGGLRIEYIDNKFVAIS